MKRRNLEELKKKTTTDLKNKIDDLEKEMLTNYLEFKMGKVKNVHLVNQKRKDIARLKTVLRMKMFSDKAEDTTSEVSTKGGGQDAAG